MAATARRRSTVVVAVVVLLALTMRVGYVVLTPDYRPLSDAGAYDALGVSLARDGTFARDPHRMGPGVRLTGASAIHPPGYPLFVAAVYRISGTSGTEARWLAARLAQVILGVVTVGLIGLVARRLWDRRVALWAAALAAVYVPLVVVGGTLLSEALFVPLLLGALLSALSYRDRGGRLRLVAAGALAGAAALTRDNGFVVALACVPLVMGPRSAWSRGRLLAACAVPLLAAAVVAPWTVRNAMAVHAFVPVSDLDGGTLAGTYNNVSAHDGAARWLWRQPQEDPVNARLLRTSRDRSEPVLQARLRSSALRFIAHHPTAPLQVAAINSLRLADLAGMARRRVSAAEFGITPTAADAGAICFWCVAALALLGALTRTARRAPPALWLLPLALLAGVVLVTTGTPRFRAPLDPFVILPAAVGAAAIVDGLRRRGETMTARSSLQREGRRRR
jgi:4-amino-4-deoxy-L-arabinose transferase-like glycosyltransferase